MKNQDCEYSQVILRFPYISLEQDMCIRKIFREEKKKINEKACKVKALISGGGVCVVNDFYIVHNNNYEHPTEGSTFL